ncbi:thioredoxin family protein [Croceicoccus ponticola]|nr:thioredoxin family protein [Croceicoccus ponticola]
MRRIAGFALAASIAFATASCNQSAEPPAATQAQEIAWRHGDVEDALAEAKETGKPVLLYWGAEWCPPCAQMKVTLFKDPDFIAKTQDFITVYLDGDTEGAQKWGEHFGTSGYPTVIALSPDGEEITRLSSSTMASELPELLTLAAGRSRTINAVMADAKADPSSLSAEDWKILSGFDWGNDPKRFAEAKDEGALIAKLAEAAPDPAMKRRFALMAVAREAKTDDDGNMTLTAGQAKTVQDILPTILKSPAEAASNQALISYIGSDLVAALPKGAGRDALVADLGKTLAAMHADPKQSLLDRTTALRGQVALAEKTGGIGDDLKTEVRKWVAKVDKDAGDELVRKSVISYAAVALDEIGDRDAARKLLLAEVGKSQSSYYYMSVLSGFAQEDGDKMAAVDWARKAYEAAKGPATRVQWAADYSRTVMELTPADKDAVRISADAVLAELGKSPDSYYQRTRRSVERWSEALMAWSAKNDGGEVLGELKSQLAKVCAGQGKAKAATGESASCASLMQPA